jgi:hypothetical protein
LSSSTDADARAIATSSDARDARDDDARERREAAIATTRVSNACDRATAALAVDLRIDPTRVGDFARGLEEMARMGFVDDGTCAGALVRCGMDVARAVETVLASG